VNYRVHTNGKIRDEFYIVYSRVTQYWTQVTKCSKSCKPWLSSGCLHDNRCHVKCISQ